MACNVSKKLLLAEISLSFCYQKIMNDNLPVILFHLFFFHNNNNNALISSYPTAPLGFRVAVVLKHVRDWATYDFPLLLRCHNFSNLNVYNFFLSFSFPSPLPFVTPMLIADALELKEATPGDNLMAWLAG